MAPTTIDHVEPEDSNTITVKKSLVKGGFENNFIEHLPENSRKRFEKAGIDLSKGYPERPSTEEIPFYLDDAFKTRDSDYPYIPRGKNADPEKKALFAAANKVVNLTKYIGTELIGVQLKDLNEQQLDELALLIAERVVVFFRDQDLSPQKQLEIGKFFGEPEVHNQVPHVPGLPGITVLWPAHRTLEAKTAKEKPDFRNPGGASRWHTDLVHEKRPAGITHLHNDQIPEVGGDTLWASGYAAYDKLSPAFQEFLDGKTAIYRSAHSYIDRKDPLKGPQFIEREHPLVRTHPVTGWKSLWVNRSMTSRIVGLEPKESAQILEYLYRIYEDNEDIQVRFRWQSLEPIKPGNGVSALWDNRVSQHNAVWDYEEKEPRHGTRVSSLAEVPYFDPSSFSQRKALKLDE